MSIYANLSSKRKLGASKKNDLQTLIFSKKLDADSHITKKNNWINTIMYPLKLFIDPKSWHVFMQRKVDKKFISIQKKVFERDEYTCKFCGFQATKYQETINLDRDYTNNKPKNIVTACCFCSQCFFVSMIGKYGFGGGTLIYLPEMSQNELNAFCHVVFCAIENETSYKDTAQTVYRNLKFRSQAIEDKYGDNTSVPSVFGQLLIEVGDGTEELSQNFLANLRILPVFEKFKQQLARWANSAAAKLE